MKIKILSKRLPHRIFVKMLGKGYSLGRMHYDVQLGDAELSPYPSNYMVIKEFIRDYYPFKPIEQINFDLIKSRSSDRKITKMAAMETARLNFFQYPHIFRYILYKYNFKYRFWGRNCAPLLFYFDQITDATHMRELFIIKGQVPSSYAMKHVINRYYKSKKDLKEAIDYQEIVRYIL